MARPKSSQKIASEIEKSYKEARKMLVDGMQDLKRGSRAYLDSVKAITDLDRKYRKERADRGVDANNLGTAVTQSWHFVAHVAVDGSVSMHAVTKEQLPGVLARRAALAAARLQKLNKPGDEEGRRQLDEEYCDVPRKARTQEEDEE